MRALLRDRNFRLLAIGQLLNIFGDNAMIFVFGIWVKQLTGSTAQAGLVILAFAAPGLAAPLLGVFVDRFPRRWVLIWNDVGAALAVLTLLTVHNRSNVWLLYVVATLYGLSGQMYMAARSGLLVSMLPEEQLGDANGLLQSIQQGVRLGAPLAGAGLFTLWGGGSVAVLDAVTFACSVALLLPLRVSDLVRSTAPKGFIAELREGVHHVWRTRDIRLLVGVTAAVLIVIGTTEVAIYSAIDEGLHRPPQFLGLLGAATGVGAIVGGFTAGRLLKSLGEIRLAGVAMVAIGLGLGAFIAPTLVSVFPASVVIGTAVSYYLVSYTTLIQRKTAPELQGRVMSAAEAIVSTPYTFSIGLGAALITIVDYRLLYLANAVVLLIASVFLLRSPRPSVEPGLAYAASSAAE